MVNKEKLESTIRLLEKTKQKARTEALKESISTESEEKVKNKGIEMYSLGKRELTQLDKESSAFAKQVDDYINKNLGRYDELKVMTTPLVMQISDERVKPLLIVMSQRTLEKIMYKHNISPELVKELPKALSEPIMIFESERKVKQVQDGFLMMLELRDNNGATINVPVALNSLHGRMYECNVITSMYGRHKQKTGKPREEWFINHACKKGLLKYVDKEKLSRWLDDARLCGPGRGDQRESNSILADSDDFVKQNQKIIGQILSANPNAKTEADLEAAREQIYMPSVLEADRRMTSAEEHEEELKTLEERLNKLNVELNIDSPNPSLGNEGETIEAEFKEEQQEENTPEGAAASINTEPEVEIKEPEIEDKSESSDIDAKIKAAGINTDQIIANFEARKEALMAAISKTLSRDSNSNPAQARDTDNGIERYSLNDRSAISSEIENDKDKWANILSNFHKLKRNASVRVMSLPKVFEILDLEHYSEEFYPEISHDKGFSGGEIRTTIGVLNKVLQGKHITSITDEMLAQIPEKLANPVMILHSSPESLNPNTIVAVIALQDKKNAPVIATIALEEQHSKDGRFYTMTSVYGKTIGIDEQTPNTAWFQKQIDKGRLLYVDEKQLTTWEKVNAVKLKIPYIEKSPARRGLGPIPKSLIQGREITHIVRTKEDLVNAIDAESKKKLREQISKALSVKDVRNRVKGADVVDLGDGKMRLDFVNGMKWLVDTKAEKININPDVVKRDYGRDVQPEDVVSGRTRILNGETFIDLVAGMSDAKTFSHEVFEASWNILTEDEQNTLLNTYKSREAAADRYAAYLEGRVKENASPAMAVFQKLKDFFQDIRATLFGRESEDIFRQIAEGKVYERKVQTQENTERYELKAESNNKEEQNMSEQERKTTTLVAGNDFIRKDFKHGKVMYGKVLGPIRISEREQNGEKEYFASFNLAVGGKVTRVRVTSRQPIDIKTYKEGQEPVFVSGQTFLVSPKDREGKIIGERVPVLYARAIHEAEHFLKNEKGEYVYDKNGEPQKLAPPRAGRAIVSKEDCIHNELESSSKELLVGIVKESKYNVFDKALGQADKPYGYESKFRLTTVDRDKDGKPKKDEQGKTEYKVITVHCITKQPMHLDQAVSRNESSTKLLSLKGAYQMHDVKRPSDNTILRDVVTFDPVVISQYKEREKEKEKGEEAPKQETEVRAANVKDGVYKGQIISQDVENAMFIQKVGSREYSHNAANFKVKPEVGKDVKIVYKDGKGTFRAIDKEKEQANER